jgi:hypothetical protein
MTGEEGRALVPGAIVQLGAAPANLAFAYCLMVVTELKLWGVQGYVQALGTREEAGGQAYYGATWDEIEPTGGKAVWVAG